MSRYSNTEEMMERKKDWVPVYPLQRHHHFNQGTVVQLAVDNPYLGTGSNQIGHVKKEEIGVVKEILWNTVIEVNFPNRRLRVVPQDLKIMRHVHKHDIVSGMKVHAVGKDFSKDNPLAIGEVTTFAGPYVKVFFPHLGREVGLFRTQLYPATVENKSLKRALTIL